MYTAEEEMLMHVSNKLWDACKTTKNKEDSQQTWSHIDDVSGPFVVLVLLLRSTKNFPLLTLCNIITLIQQQLKNPSCETC